MDLTGDNQSEVKINETNINFITRMKRISTNSISVPPIQKFVEYLFLPVNGLETEHLDFDALKTTSNFMVKSSHILSNSLIAHAVAN